MDRLLGEHEIQEDAASGRQEFERRKETLSLKERAARVLMGTSKTANAKLHGYLRGADPKAFGAQARLGI